jgi:cell wall-associated NlpC family hydrolase
VRKLHGEISLELEVWSLEWLPFSDNCKYRLLARFTGLTIFHNSAQKRHCEERSNLSFACSVVFVAQIASFPAMTELSTSSILTLPNPKSYSTIFYLFPPKLILRKMKLLNLTIAICTILVFASCSSIRNISSKDSSGSTALKKPKSTGKREFLNGIEVTPGGVTAATQYITPVKNDPNARRSVVERPDPAALATIGMGLGIESANMLQMKYAIATDASVEKMTNIPLLQTIDKWWGTKYCMGGATGDCIDCSAFTQVVLRDVYQLSLPRTSQEQFAAVEKVELEDLREGDLVFFNTSGKDISHVGIYLLNNKFVHAATSGGVMISDLNEKYWQPKFRGAGRVRREEDVKGGK